jgi:arylsulfatase A-like enzyme
MGANYPNILYIHSHDTGRYVQPYGHAIPTPHIQQLAEEGMLFRLALVTPSFLVVAEILILACVLP